MENKLIITDVDGVMLNWYSTFKVMMKEQGYVKNGNGSAYHFQDDYGITRSELRDLIESFNQSDYMKTLEPIKDAGEWVPKIAELGYKFDVITSQTDDFMAKFYRIDNLNDVFGDIFGSYHILGMGEDKDNYLKEYEGTNFIWVEDKPENAHLGLQYGLQCLLMDHDYNQEYVGGAQRVENWEEIYNMVK